MPQPKVISDNTPARLNQLTARLQERLVEAEDIRIRFTKALDANAWPNVRCLSPLFAENDRHSGDPAPALAPWTAIRRKHKHAAVAAPTPLNSSFDVDPAFESAGNPACAHTRDTRYRARRPDRRTARVL